MSPRQESNSSVNGWGRACCLAVNTFEMLAQGNFRGRRAERGSSVRGWPKCSVRVPRSYLLIDFHGLLGVVEKELFPGRSQVHVYLEAGVLREFPAVRTTAEGAVKGFCDGRIHQGALRLLGPHATRQGRGNTGPDAKDEEGVIRGDHLRLLELENLPQIDLTICLLEWMPLNREALDKLQQTHG